VKLIAGLGNPGETYANTPHNVGFDVVDLLAQRLEAGWKNSSRFQARVARTAYAGQTLMLVKPQTFMNLSGKAVARLAASYDIPITDIVVVHDDLDLPEETLRIKRGGGHGGHNGLRSLGDSLGAGAFIRVKIGLGRPPGRQDPAKYVLEPLRPAALEQLAAMTPHAAQAVIHILEHGVESAMREYNAG
jgi:PTH1 family peptidyl-tRNA hydrolase